MRLLGIDVGTGGTRALIIDEHGALILFEIVTVTIPDQLDFGELHERKIFLMTDSPFINEIAFDAESRGDCFVSPRAGDGWPAEAMVPRPVFFSAADQGFTRDVFQPLAASSATTPRGPIR